MSINYFTNLHLIQGEMRQADPLNKEEVQNQKETKKQISQEEYKIFYLCSVI